MHQVDAVLITLARHHLSTGESVIDQVSQRQRELINLQELDCLRDRHADICCGVAMLMPEIWRRMAMKHVHHLHMRAERNNALAANAQLRASLARLREMVFDRTANAN